MKIFLQKIPTVWVLVVKRLFLEKGGNPRGWKRRKNVYVESFCPPSKTEKKIFFFHLSFPYSPSLLHAIWVGEQDFFGCYNDLWPKIFCTHQRSLYSVSKMIIGVTVPLSIILIYFVIDLPWINVLVSPFYI